MNCSVLTSFQIMVRRKVKMKPKRLVKRLDIKMCALIVIDNKDLLNNNEDKNVTNFETTIKSMTAQENDDKRQ